MNKYYDNLNLYLKNNCQLAIPEHKELFSHKNNSPHYEGNYFYDSLNGMSWNEIAANDFSVIKKTFSRNRALSFFTDDGFLYYFPAFVLYFSQYDDLDLMQPFCFRLEPGDTEEQMNRFGNLVQGLDDKQVGVIKYCLSVLDEIWAEWGVKDNDARRALNEYWSYVD